MIRKHWMLRFRPAESSETIAAEVEKLDKYNYESVLFTVNSRIPDMWTTVANAINKSHKIKYMLAVRPYLFSPQFLTMLVASFNRLTNERLMINIVHGDISPYENFTNILNGEQLQDKKFRKQYDKEFVNKFISGMSTYPKMKIPEIVISGSSEETFDLAQSSSNIVAVWANDFLDNPTRFADQKFNKIFIVLPTLIRETDEDCEKEIAKISKEDRELLGYILYGSRETVAKKLLELEKMGVTDILFSQMTWQHEIDLVHESLKDLSNAGILS